jgi:hypothetical protein
VTQDPIQAAAASVVGIPASGGGEVAKLKSYPSPMKYKDDPFARKLDGFLDKAGDPDAASILSAPASTVMVGECAMASAEAWGVKADGTHVPIHPGWLLLFSVLAYAAMVAFVHFAKRKDAPKTLDPKVEEQRRAQLASLA